MKEPLVVGVLIVVVELGNVHLALEKKDHELDEELPEMKQLNSCQTW